MDVSVIGAGAVGGYLAARLALAGHAVTVVARGAQLDAIRVHGLRLVAADGTAEVANVRVADAADSVGPTGLVVLAVKAHQIAAVASGVPTMLGPATPVVALQNGLPWWYFHRHGGPLDGVRLAALDPDGTIEGNIPTERV